MQSPVRVADVCGEGTRLDGKYKLRRLLGEGGMGNVWLADNEVLELPVAVKIMRPEVRGGDAAARFLTEARVQAKLSHPHVVRVFDYGETPAGDAYIVMELLEGCTLAEWLETRGAFTPVSAVQMLLPVIDALCATHRAGVVHRDLKPDNIFIVLGGEQPFPKLLDFGIAKLDNECETRRTNPNGLIGSPAYMAPEQACGLEDVDQRADVWAACVVLYECITGEPAYDGANFAALLRKVIQCDLPALEGPATADLWPILRAGLRRERTERTATMRELGVALAGWLVSRGEYEDVCREPLGWRWSRASGMDDVFEFAAPRSIAEAPQRTGAYSDTLLASAPGDSHGFMEWLRGVRPSAARFSLGVCLGAGVLAFGMGQAEQDPRPEPAVAHVVQLAANPAAIAVAEVPKRRAPQPPAAATPLPQPNAPAPTPAPAPEPTPQRAEVAPRALPPPVPAKPVLIVKRRALASEAELGLKNPW